ncbi:MAG: hypothetical protein WC570_04130 [Patescibacteria group bacterium]
MKNNWKKYLRWFLWGQMIAYTAIIFGLLVFYDLSNYHHTILIILWVFDSTVAGYALRSDWLRLDSKDGDKQKQDWRRRLIFWQMLVVVVVAMASLYFLDLSNDQEKYVIFAVILDLMVTINLLKNMPHPSILESDEIGPEVRENVRSAQLAMKDAGVIMLILSLLPIILLAIIITLLYIFVPDKMT